MSVSDLGTKRWEREPDPAAHKPTEALYAAIRAIEEGRIDPAHAIVILGRDAEDGGSGHQFFQSGSYRCHAQLGLLQAGMFIIWGSEP